MEGVAQTQYDGEHSPAKGNPMSNEESSSPGRRETQAEEHDRNWNELLQELRVSQTGVQLLTGFLLTLPFQDRFSDLDSVERNVYLCIVCAAVLATGLLIAPVAFHRLLFRQGEKDWLVSRGNLAANAGLAFLAVAMTGVVWLIFDVVAGRLQGFVFAGAAAVIFALLWWLMPLQQRLDES
jgi:Family of unknown function (DUF6328)